MECGRSKWLLSSFQTIPRNVFTWVFWSVGLRGRKECIKTLSKRNRIRVILSLKWSPVYSQVSLQTDVLCHPHLCSLTRQNLVFNRRRCPGDTWTKEKSFTAQRLHKACNFSVSLFALTELWHILKLHESYYFLWQDIYIVMTLRLKLPSQKYCLDLVSIKWWLSLVPYQKRCAKKKNHIVLNPTFKSLKQYI